MLAPCVAHERQRCDLLRLGEALLGGGEGRARHTRKLLLVAGQKVRVRGVIGRIIMMIAIEVVMAAHHLHSLGLVAASGGGLAAALEHFLDLLVERRQLVEDV